MGRVTAFALALGVLLLVAVLDQATKALALASLEPGESVSVFFALDLSLTRNTGIAFGALAGAGEAAIVALVAVALGVLLAFFAARATRPLLWLPVGMVLGGAVGNLIDRARRDAVIDFIDPIFWPAFNLADVAIVGGVLGVLYVAEGRPGEETAVEEDARSEEDASAEEESRSEEGASAAGEGHPEAGAPAAAGWGAERAAPQGRGEERVTRAKAPHGGQSAPWRDSS